MTTGVESEPVLAPLPATFDTFNDPGRLGSRLGVRGILLLRHLQDGRPTYLPGFLPGPDAITEPTRSPRIRFLTGLIVRHPDQPRTWCGPVLLPGEWQPYYVDPRLLGHLDCEECRPVWDSAVAFDGFDSLAAKRGALILSPHLRSQGAA